MVKKKKKNPQQPTLSEAAVIWATKLLEEFRASSNDTHVFEQNLSNSERGILHQMCRRLGLVSKSHGSGDQRRLSISKPKANSEHRSGDQRRLSISNKANSEHKYETRYQKGVMKGTNKSYQKKLKCVSFPPEAKAVLRELFTRYPPCEGDTTGTSLGIYTGKFNMRRKDDFFLKPQSNKKDIKNKVASLRSRLEKDKCFRQIFEARSKLPITSFRNAIISAVESNQVTLIAGETGCGKTTQVPQYLLDHIWNSKGEACKIICTQPRRISAISVSERIAWERGENIGDNVGYKVRLQSEGGRWSSVVFCTNGILLRVLIGKGANSCVPDITHIIVDEIHERDSYSDFMLAILRDLLPSNPHIRLILMSATLDAERFSEYFGGCPVVRVPGFTYPVRTFFLEDALSVLQSDKNNHLLSADSSILGGKRDIKDEDKLALDEAIDLAWTNDVFDALSDLVSSEGIHEAYNYRESMTGLTPLMVFAGKGRVSDVCKLLSFGADCTLKSKEGITALELAEKENQYETAQIIKEHADNIQSNSQQAQDLLDKYMATIKPEEVDVGLIVRLMKKICIDSRDGAILVFLPGWEEISKTNEKLSATPFFANSAEFRILCLHSKVPAEEQKKVFIRPPGRCRKIVLATNIAESAVTIDDVVYVIDSGRMKEKSYDPYNDVSTLQSSWVSKANAKQREGRAGRCQPGICYHLYSKLRAASLPEYRVPEVRRMPVDELCLQVKMLDPSCNVNVFLQKLMDPPVAQSIANALAILKDIGALTHKEELTELGQKFGQLPVHPRISKMLYFAILVNCLDPALILACAADTKDPFILPMLPGDRKKAAAAKRELASLYGDYSDHLATVAAFQCWKSAKESGQTKAFCSKYFISQVAMKMLDSLCKKLQGELKRHGFIPSSSYCSLNAHDPGILHAVVAVGFYPMVGRLCPLSKNNTRSVVETITGTNVRVPSLSNNVNISTSKYDEALIVFDEITRGDWGVHIRSCTLLPTIPLLLFSREIAVSPTESYAADKCDDEEDAIDIDKAGERPGEKVMLEPDNSVKVVVDRWLSYKVTAFEIAQMYILRERLMASILFKVKHPNEDLPPHLGASMNAIACILSYDGLTERSGQTVAVKPIATVVDATSIREDITSTNSNGEHENTTSMGSKLESTNKSGLDNMEESLPSTLAIGNEQPDPNTVPVQSSSKKLKSVDNVDLGNIEENLGCMEENLGSMEENLGNMEENKPSDLRNNGNEQILPKSASNLDMGDMKENKPSDLADGNEQTESESVNNMDSEKIKTNMPSDMAKSNEQTEPNPTPMEPASVAKQPKKRLSKSKRRKLANNVALQNVEEATPADLANGNEQTETKSVINLDLGNMENNTPSDLTNGNEITESKSSNKLNLENMGTKTPDLINGNEQTEPNAAPLEAPSAAKQPKRKQSRSKRRRSANNLNLENMEGKEQSDIADGNRQPDPNTVPLQSSSKKRKSVDNVDLGNIEENLGNMEENLGNMEENKPSDLSNNGDEQILPKSASNLDMGDMKENKPSDLADGNEQTESESVNNMDSEKIKTNMPSDMAKSNEQSEPKPTMMEPASVAKQPKKRLSKSKRRKLANNVALQNVEEATPADLANGNEQTEAKSVINLDLGNTENNTPSDLTKGNEITDSKSSNKLDLENMDTKTSDLINGNEQTEPNAAPLEAPSAAKQPKRKQSRSKRRRSATNTLNLENMEEKEQSDLADGNEQPDPNPAPDEAASAPKQQKKKSKRRKLAKNIDLDNNMKENMPSTSGIEQPDLNSALTEAASMAERYNNEVQTGPKSWNNSDLIEEKVTIPSDHVEDNEPSDPNATQSDAA